MAAPPSPPGSDRQLMGGAPPFPPEALVTLGNWQEPPFNRWAFQHIRELLAETYTDGFLVLHRGRIVTEQYFNGMGPDTPHLLMSVSKSVVSSVAGILAGQGLLDVNARVEQVVPELA